MPYDKPTPKPQQPTPAEPPKPSPSIRPEQIKNPAIVGYSVDKPEKKDN